MKYLLLALFIGTAYGQDSIRLIGGGDTIIYPNNSIRLYEPQKIKTNEQKLAEHWENYKKSLDSTFKHQLMKEIENRQYGTKQYEVYNFDDYVMITSKGRYAEFIDKVKPTLDGFMKYLKELK